MSEYEPKPGDRVRVTFETVVDDRNAPGNTVLLGQYLGQPLYVCDRVEADNISIERLPDPEPEWQPGDVVRDGDGNVWNYPAYGKGWALVFSYTGHAATTIKIGNRDGKREDEMTRPLVHLIRDGKPVG